MCINKPAGLCTKAVDSVIFSGQPSQTKVSNIHKYIEPFTHSRLYDITDTHTANCQNPNYPLLPQPPKGCMLMCDLPLSSARTDSVCTLHWISQSLTAVFVEVSVASFNSLQAGPSVNVLKILSGGSRISQLGTQT